MHLVICDICQPFVLLTLLVIVFTPDESGVICTVPTRGCSGICPTETYESRPCSDTKDRECSVCSLCRRSFYEVSPCTAKSNRRCYHAAYPLLMTGQSTIPRFIEEFHQKKPEHKKRKKLKVEASSNIFLEDLQNTRNLETTYYVTDMTQASDFYWDRESELRVNIGILDVHLIPEYHDVSHDGDNEYMLSNPNESEDRSKYQHIIQNACRNPIPDYYSITLEVSPDRTTVAHRVTCDSKDSSKPKCLPPYKDGDTFLHRTLNEPCHKMLKGTFPDVLLPAANSIVCTDNSALLSEIFNRTFTEERPIRFPPKKCTTATIRCNQCKNSHHCQALELFVKKCCLIDCYNLIDCKIAMSEECLSAPVECAMGDAYRYTIQPVFHTIKNQFRCHLQHHRVTVLYKLFYFIQIPAIGFQTPKVHQTIYAHDLGYHQNGKYKADYLTVEHNTDFNLQDDFILTGQELNGRFNYSVHSAVVTDQNRQVDIHDISDKIFMASAQFERPFDYSSSTWVNNNDCNKNISKIKPIYDQPPADTQEVSVLFQDSAEPFQYFLKSVNSPPFIRFTVPGNTSILPYYFQDNGPFLYTNESLSVSVELSPAGRIWLIHVTGKMSGCPAYLGLTINDRLEMEQLFHYDLLIVCPPEFNLTFKIPNWGQQTHKTFDITFQDPSKTFAVFSTHLGSEHHTTLESHSDIRLETQPLQPMSMIIFLVIGIITVYSIVMSFFVRACVHRKRSKFSHENADGLMLGSTDQSLTGKRLHQMVSRQICLTTTYVVTRFLYSLFMSVTALSLGILFLTKQDIAVLSRISQFQLEQADMLANISAEIEREIQAEIVRYQRLVDERQTSCSNYIGDLMIGVSRLMETVVYENHLAYMYGPENSISYLIVNQTQVQFLHYMDSVDSFLIGYKTKLNAALLPLYTHYRKYLRSVYESEWLAFAQRLFNTTQPIIQKPSLEYDKLAGDEVDFSMFLVIEEVEQFRMWSTQFWERFYFQYPNLFPVFPDVNITRANLHCDADIFSNMTAYPQLDHFDSTHFFGTYYFEDSTDTKRILAREKTAVTDLPRETRLPVTNQDSIEIIGSSLLWLICIVLDVLLMSHRMCRTYCCAKALYARLQQPMPRDRLIYRRKDSPRGNGQQIATNHLISQKEKRHTSKEEFPQSAETVGDQYACIRYNDSSGTEQDCYHDNKSPGTNNRKRCQTVRSIFSTAVRSRLVPQLVVAAMLMVLLCFLLKACMTFLEADALIDNNIFGAFVSPVVIQANLSSSFVTEQAEQITAQMRIYENQMHSELASLKSIMLYFNLEQKWLVDNYIRETCAFHQLHIPTSGRNCDVKVPLQNLDVPMLPCNFLPLEPRLYIEFTASTYERQMAVAFQQFASSIANVVFTILRYLFILVAITLTVHVIGNTLFHCLRVHSGSARQWTQTTAYLQIDQHSHPFTGAPNSSERESENYDHQRERRPMTARATTATLVNASPTRVTAMLFDFGYSETKV